MLAIVLFLGMVFVFGVPFQMLGMPSEGAVICGIIGAVCCVAWIITNENNKRNPGPAPTVVHPEPLAVVDPSAKSSLNEQMADLRAKLNRLQEISYSLEAASPEVLPISIETYLGMFFKSFLYEVAREIRCSNEDCIAVLEQLFDQALLRGNMELYFAMGGAEYLEQRRDAAEYGEQRPAVDDAVYGVASIFDAMLTGDNDRFHLETVHHSEQEIEMMLQMGRKLERVVRVVDDDDEQQQKKHDPAKELYYASLLLGDLLRAERKHQQEQEDDYEHSDMDENSIRQESVDDPCTTYDEEPEEYLEEDQDMEYQQYHGFGFGGMGGMSM